MRLIFSGVVDDEEDIKYETSTDESNDGFGSDDDFSDDSDYIRVNMFSFIPYYFYYICFFYMNIWELINILFIYL